MLHLPIKPYTTATTATTATTTYTLTLYPIQYPSTTSLTYLHLI
jgi:hypothetical protein